FRKLATAHHLQKLHGELDLADAAARELDVVGALRSPGSPAVGLVADLAVQLAQAFENTVVEVATEHEGRDQVAQGQGAFVVSAVWHGDAGRHDAAFEPGKALPLAALYQEVFLQHAQTDHRGAGVAIGAQGQVHAKDKAVFGGVADQGGQALDDLGEVLMRRDLRPQPAAAVVNAGGLAVVFVDVNEID